jgi:DNA-binding response OmpR family regulator
MKLRLLIVDDQKDVARTLARALRGRGFEVFVTNSCEAARDFEEPVDCAILDVDLPDGSGLDLASTLSCSRNVVFFSGCADIEVRRRAMSIGSFVAKSAGLNELLMHIEHAIQRQPRVAAPHETEVLDEPGNSRLPPNVSGSYAASRFADARATSVSASFPTPLAALPEERELPVDERSRSTNKRSANK